MPQQDNEQTVAVSDYSQAILERRWLIIGLFFVCWALAWSASWVMPAKYRSETLIIVEQPKIPEQYVVPNVSVDLQERLQTMTEQIMSRTRLEKIIGDLQLYGVGKNGLTPDLLVERMRKDIEVELVISPNKRDVDAFHIYYSATSPQMAQRVASELSSLFIQENLRAQQEQSQVTTEFLTSELDQARTSLAEQEAKVREFKSQHVGELPSQLQSNMGILSGLQSQQEGLTAALNRAQQQKLYLESLYEQYRSLQAAGDRGGPNTPTIDDEIAKLRGDLAAAQARYTDQNPDVIRLKDELARKERLKQQMEANGAKSNKANDKPALSSSSPMLQVQGQLKANAQEIKDAQAQLKAVDQQIREYQSRLNSAPLIEQRLADLTRDYDQSKTNYDSLLQKQMQSKMATNLEKRQQGQQFRVLDPPGIPSKPFSPNRLKISLMGMGAGLGLGLALALLLELIDPKIWNEKQLKGLVAARVLVGIPHIALPGEVQRKRRRLVLEWVGGTAILMIVAAGNAFTFLRG